MSDGPQYQPGGVNPKVSAEFRVPPRTWFVWVAILGGIILLMLVRDHMGTDSEFLPQYAFLRMVDSNQIAQATISYNPQNSPLAEITGKYYKLDSRGERLPANDPHALVPFHSAARLTENMEDKLFNMPEFQPREPHTMLMNVIWSVLPIFIIAVLIWFFFIARIKKVARTTANSAEAVASTALQRMRLDKILDKWEELADRLEAVLEKIQKDKGSK